MNNQNNIQEEEICKQCDVCSSDERGVILYCPEDTCPKKNKKNKKLWI